MNILQAARQALEALEDDPDAMIEVSGGHWDYKRDLAITALRQAIEQAQQYVMENAQGELERISLVQTGVGIGKPKQEPVGEIVQGFADLVAVSIPVMPPVGTKLYTTPPQRKPLTDEEIFEVHKRVDSMQYLTFARAIESKHGIGGGE